MIQNDADTPPPVAPTADVPTTDDPAALPKRRRQARKPPEGAVDAAASPAETQPVASSEHAGEQAPSPHQAPAAMADAALGAGVQAVPGRPDIDGVPVNGAAVDGAQSAVGGDEQPPADAEPAGAEAPRRNRNRRRGRRGGERGDRGSAPADANAQAGPGTATAPVPAQDDGSVGDGGAGDDEDREADFAGAGADAPQQPPRQPPDVGALFAEVLSGAFDVEPTTEAVDPTQPLLQKKRVLAAEPDAPKLHKVLAQAGVGSRRDMEQMIVDGSITVNGEPAHIGQRISFGDRIAVAGKPVRFRIAPPPPRVLAYHKPAGEVVTHDDPQQRPTVFRRLPRLQNGKWQSVGRLDINTEGLLLFTNSGELANQLMHPRFGVEREYAVRSLGVLGDEAKALLMEGVDIDGQRCAFRSIVDGGGEGANHWYRCVITEGRNREVRKLFEAVGHAVSRLIRIRYGSVVLPLGLKRGVWVDLDDFDVRSLHQITGVQQGERAGERRGNRRGGTNANKRGRNGAEQAVQAAPRAQRPDVQQQPQQPPRPDRGPRADRPQRPDRGERGEGGAIPNPLQQTFDKRAIQQERALRRDMPEDGPIPNPLQQTYDKRALQRDRQPQRDMPDDGPIPNPLQQTYDKRFSQQSRGFGPGGSAAAGGGGGRAGANGQRGRKKPGGNGSSADARQPDPMKTSVGYIGGDAFLRKAGGGSGPQRSGPRNGRGGGSTGGNGNGNGNPGRNSGGNRGGRTR